MPARSKMLNFPLALIGSRVYQLMTKTKAIQKLLAANRSEIAIRIFRAANELGLRTVGIYSQEDRLGLHRFKADEAYQVGAGKGPVEAYLDIAGIVALAKEKNAGPPPGAGGAPLTSTVSATATTWAP